MPIKIAGSANRRLGRSGANRLTKIGWISQSGEMTLSDYLAHHALTYAAFALRIGSNHARTVERYAKGHQVPNPTMMRRIVEVTESRVTPNDFFGLSAGAAADHTVTVTATSAHLASGKSCDLAASAEARS